MRAFGAPSKGVGASAASSATGSTTPTATAPTARTLCTPASAGRSNGAGAFTSIISTAAARAATAPPSPPSAPRAAAAHRAKSGSWVTGQVSPGPTRAAMRVSAGHVSAARSCFRRRACIIARSAGAASACASLKAHRA